MRRGKERWTHADDKRLGRALLSVFDSQGEVMVLSDNRALWKRVQQRYQELVVAEPPDVTAAQRSARSLHTRWARGIRPDMVLFASLVDKMQKAGKKPSKAIKQAVKLFRGRRSETNAAAVRQFVQERQLAPATSGDSETDSAHPKLKFESFHFRHCYDILCSSSKFMEMLLELSKKNGGSEPLKKHRRVEGGKDSQEKYSSSTSSDESVAADSHKGEKRVVMLQDPRADRFEVERVGSISRKHPSSWQNPQATANGVESSARPSNATYRDRGSVVINFEGASDDLELSHLECDRAVANEYVRLRMQTLKDDRRLKLLAELRGVVTTMSQLAQQLAWNGVASAALTARTGGVCPALDQDVLRDIAFFRHEKQRLKQEITDLDGPVTNGTNSN